MSLPRFFLDEQVLSAQAEPVFKLDLTPEDLHHSKVLRLRSGEHIAVVDAASDYFECEVTSLDDDGLFVSIAGHERPSPSLASVVLFVCIAKGDKMETVIRQCTELGVAAIQPVLSSRCVVKLDAKKKDAKLARWKTVAKNAAMQSGRGEIPEIRPVISLVEVIDALEMLDGLIVFWEEQQGGEDLGNTLDDLKGKGQERTPILGILIGPEGGLAEDEVALLTSASDRVFLHSLGPLILRFETAAVVGSALVLAGSGGLGDPWGVEGSNR